MIIESIHVKNYRSIFNESLPCENLTVLVGPNGVGKSSFVRALDLFYNSSPKIDIEDFYNRDKNSEIVIAITFKDLSPEAINKFQIYVQDGKLTVEKVFHYEGERIVAKYHGSRLQNPDFTSIRDGLEIKDRGKTAKEAYETIRSRSEYCSLPQWPSRAYSSDIPEILKKWESENKTKCERRRDEGQFFGFKEVGQSHLEKFTQFLFIPAVRDAYNDSSEGKGSVFTRLMDFAVRSVLANKESIKKLKEDAQAKYNEIVAPEKLTELSTLADNMTKTLRTFVPEATIDLQWLPLEEINIPMPQADVKLIEDGYSAPVTRTGHGLQRAFILTIFQHLAVAQNLNSEIEAKEIIEEKNEPKLPDLFLAIEEPELYQHPSRQRHFSKILNQLAGGKTPGVANSTQVIYCTHSPLFVGVDRINSIRLLKERG